MSFWTAELQGGSGDFPLISPEFADTVFKAWDHTGFEYHWPHWNCLSFFTLEDLFLPHRPFCQLVWLRHGVFSFSAGLHILNYSFFHFDQLGYSLIWYCILFGLGLFYTVSGSYLEHFKQMCVPTFLKFVFRIRGFVICHLNLNSGNNIFLKANGVHLHDIGFYIFHLGLQSGVE